MHLKFKNVNDAFKGLVQGIHDGTIPTYTMPSRVGEVQQVEEPVIVTYSHPLERVLFNQARDANPFFNLYEALYMLAGKNEIAPLAYYSSNYAAQVQDGDNPNANGAYGHRWRQAKTYEVNGIEGVSEDYSKILNDQLKILIDHLKRKPESRRAVLEMWDAEGDLLRIDTSKDVCCNTHVYFAIGQGKCKTCDGSGKVPHNWDDKNLQRKIDQEYEMAGGARHDNDKVDEQDRYAKIKEYREGYQRCTQCKGKPHDHPRYLNMTVCNRSNDLIWGMLGANVVHFSFLQEYMAAHLGLEVGVYNQFTNNLHCYTARWEPEEWMAERQHDFTGGQADYPKSVPLVKDPVTFDKEVVEFAEQGWGDQPMTAFGWQEPFFATVAVPMRLAFYYYKQKDLTSAINCTEHIAAEDWRIACKQWLERRVAKRGRVASARAD